MSEGPSGIKEIAANAIRWSIKDQQPSRKNQMSRDLADALSPQIKPVIETPTPVQVEQPLENKLPETPEAAEARLNNEVIRKFVEKNQNSLRDGNESLGWWMGAGENEIFVLSQPQVEDVDVKSTDEANKDQKARLHKYVVFTQKGPRKVVFNKGRIDPTTNNLITTDGGTFDDRYQGGESHFLYALKDHTTNTQDQFGFRKNYVAETSDGGKITYEQYYGSSFGMQNVDIQGTPTERVSLGSYQYDRDDRGKDANRVFWIQEPTKQEILTATEKAIEFSQRKRELPVDRTQNNIQTANEVLAYLK